MGLSTLRKWGGGTIFTLDYFTLHSNYYQQKLSTSLRLIKTEPNDVLLPTLFIVVKNIVKHCYTRFRLNNIVQHCYT